MNWLKRKFDIYMAIVVAGAIWSVWYAVSTYGLAKGGIASVVVVCLLFGYVHLMKFVPNSGAWWWWRS